MTTEQSNPQTTGTTKTPDSIESKTNAKLAQADEELKSAIAQESKLGGGAEGQAAREYSATTIARMMGIATLSDLGVIESKLDLAMTKITGLTLKLEKALGILNGTPTGNDLERIDVQIGSLKTMIREVLDSAGKSAEEVQEVSKEALKAAGLLGNKTDSKG